MQIAKTTTACTLHDSVTMQER